MPKRTKKTTAETATGTEIKLVGAAPKATRKRAAKAKATEPDSKPEPRPTLPEEPTTTEEQVVFAFRLSRASRDAIHAAAGPAKASKFVKSLAIAAAQGDIDTIHQIVGEVVRAK